MMQLVLCATAAELLGALAERAYECVITDPPYGEYVHAHAVSNGTGGAGVVARDLGPELTPELRETIAEIIARARRWGVIFSDIEGAAAWRDSVPVECVRAIPWVRWSQPQLSGDRPPSGAELVSVYHPPGAKHWSGPGSLTHFNAKSLRGREKHPCEKPLDLMLSIVSWFSDAGETVVDPCCGSGTTALACRLLGRSCIAADQDLSWIQHARSRLDSPLSDRDRERCERWIESQAWAESDVPDTAAGTARYARAVADTQRVREALR
jgi:hypothetical protein